MVLKIFKKHSITLSTWLVVSVFLALPPYVLSADSTDPTISAPTDIVEPESNTSEVLSTQTPSSTENTKEKKTVKEIENSALLNKKPNLPEIQLWFETISPALQGGSIYPPNQDGSTTSTLSVFSNSISVVQKICPHLSFLLSQKTNFTLSGNPAQSFQLSPKNPKIGIRISSVSKPLGDSPLRANHDFTIQPSWIPDAVTPLYRKSFELGFKNSGRIVFKNSPWSLWGTVEFSGIFYSYNTNALAKRYTFSVQPAVRYRLYPAVSGYPLFTTHHGFNLSFMEASDHRIIYDNSGPYMQNGVTVVFSKKAYLSALINNYILVAPTLKNTWLTIGFNISVL